MDVNPEALASRRSGAGGRLDARGGLRRTAAMPPRRRSSGGPCHRQHLPHAGRALPDEDRLYICGGAGGGTMAIQIARWMGAEGNDCLATWRNARPPPGRRPLHQLHARNVRDVRQDHDAPFDLIGSSVLTDTFPILQPGGKVVSIAGAQIHHRPRPPIRPDRGHLRLPRAGPRPKESHRPDGVTTVPVPMSTART
jgi:NADPH:quinone reductase-like Zn-dependent oxidoreductase